MSNKVTAKSAVLWIIKGGLFIVPFIPLYISKVLFFPYITGKAFVFRIVIEIVFAAWVFLAILYKEYRPKKTYLTLALSIFIVVVTLATVFGANSAKSFWSNFERMEGLVSYLHLFAYFLVLTHIFRKSDWHTFLNLFVLAAIYENSYAFLQSIGVLLSPQGGTSRADGTIGNPTYLAAYLIFILSFCFLLWMDAKQKWQKYFYGIMAVWTLITIYFTATRGATLALLGGAMIFVVLYLLLKHSDDQDKAALNKKAILIILAFLVTIPAVTWFLKDTSLIRNNPILNRLTSFSLQERTITSRFTIWSMSFEGFKERPILGWGPSNYDIVFSKYFKAELWQQEPWFDRSHNIVFDWLINAGILGILSYFGIFVAAMFLLWQHFNKKNISLERALLIATFLLVYLAQNFFVFDQIATYIGFFAILAYINSFSVKETTTLSISRERSDWPVVAGILLVPLVSIIYFINVRPLLANLNLLSALAIQGQNIPLAFEKFSKALSYNTLGNQEIREQLIRFAIGAGGIQELGADFRDKMLRKAIEEAEKSVAENPLDPRSYLFLGTIYQKVGLSDQALAVFNKAIELSPQKQQIYFELADVYLQKGDYQNAILALEKSFKLDTEFSSGRINLSAAYILNNQQAESEKLLKEGFGAVDVADQILAQAYSRVKNYNRLVGVWGAFVKKNPDNLEYRKNLAGAYLSAGNKTAAIGTIQEAIQINPSFKAEGEAYIQQIKSEK
ncbi:MAG: O-antigen ligase family protein [bacterium]|nr:O-antigen ligase family protein [bacterium]